MPEMLNVAVTTGLTGWYILRAVVFLLAFLGAGSIWPRLPRGDYPRILYLALVAALGMGWMGCVILVLGLFGIMNPWLLGAIVCVSLARGAFFLHSVLACPEPGPPATGEKLSVLTGALLAMSVLCGLNVLFGALAPDTQQDSLWYHLSCPRAWVEWGRIIAWPSVWPSNYSLHGLVLYSLLLSFGNEIDCSLLYAFQGFLTYGIAAFLAARWFGRTAGIWTWFLCATAHAANVWFVPIHTGSDLSVAMYMTGGILLAVDVLFAGDDGDVPLHGIAHLLSAAVLIGFASVTKTTALGYALVPFWVLCAWGVARRRLSLRFAATVWCASMIPLALWAVRGFLFGCGNPVYPVLRELFPVRPEYACLTRNPANSIYPLSFSGFIQALQNFPAKLDYASMGRSQGFIIHGAILFGLGTRNRRLRALGLVGLLQWIVYLWTVGWNETIRYFAACYPAIFAGVSAGIVWFMRSAPVSRPVRVAAISIFAAMLFGNYAWRQVEWARFKSIDWHFHPVLTHADRVRYLSTKGDCGLVNVPLYEWINENTPKDAVVLLADISYPFYVKRRYLWSDPDRTYFDYLAETGVSGSAGVRKWLEANNVNYVIADPATLSKFPGWRDVLEPVGEADQGTPAKLYRPLGASQ